MQKECERPTVGRICCPACFAGHFFRRPTAFAKAGEDLRDMFRLDFEQQRVAWTKRVGHRLQVAFVLAPTELFPNDSQFTIRHTGRNLRNDGARALLPDRTALQQVKAL